VLGNLGYNLHMKADNIDVMCSRAKVAAGEILERHHLPTTKKFDPELIKELPKDFQGHVTLDDVKPTNIIKSSS
jgi:hypothetical protein